MHWPDLIPPLPLDACERAAAMLEAADGDWRACVELLPAWRGEWSEDYLARMEWLLTPHGEA